MAGKPLTDPILEAKRTFTTGENFYCQQLLGCHAAEVDGAKGFIFRVWAPHARSVHVVGNFSDWNVGLPMTLDSKSGIWEVFTVKAQLNDLYKYRVEQADGTVVLKIDPFAFHTELRPGNASKVFTLPEYKWHDGLWKGRKKRENQFQRPLNIYEVHANSWQQHEDGSFYTWEEMKEHLIPYVKDLGFTHIEFMPLMEYPLDASWGYQLTGYFALTPRFGDPASFMDFIEACHLNNLGVIVDWVPGHFNANADTLRYYDGTPTFEYQDPDRAQNHDWGALNFDLGKPQVQSFLISSLLFWLDTYHLDGIRVDAVSNMIYRDFDSGPWTPNKDGGRENYEGTSFLKKMNAVSHQVHPEVLMVAEESGSEIKITGTLEMGGLGFDYKWDLGWMNDTLKFFEMDPLYRKYNLTLLTFSFMYMYNENFILPLSHDEVVHGKKSLMHKMWGDRYKQKAQLRNLMTYMMTHPGKKLNFMGNEWGQFIEWRFYQALQWVDLEDELNQRELHFFGHLNQFYRENRSLWELDLQPEGFEVIDADNYDETVLSYLRKGKKQKDFSVVVLNLTPIERREFVIAVPKGGTYREVLNTEMKEFGGTWTEGNGIVKSRRQTFKQFDQVISFTLPALGAVIFQPEQLERDTKNKK